MENKENRYAVIYARYSSDRQREESIEGQLRICEDFAKRNNLKVINTYIDRAQTGRSDRRPEFQHMIKDAAQKHFQFILVYKLNRFARSRYDSSRYRHILNGYGVRIMSATENIPGDPSGILLESVIEGLAEFYSAELAENVLRGMTENVLEGKWPGGPVPLGYKVVDHYLQIDETKAPYVRQAYRLYIEGHSLSSIIRELTAAGCLTANGKPISMSTLDRMLCNERYTGTLIWRDIRHANVYPVIIDPDTYAAAQAVMKRRKKTRSNSDYNFLLSGKLYCAHCGALMSGTSGTSRQGVRYYYYVCASRQNACDTGYIRADRLEDKVFNATLRIINNPKAIEAIAKQAMAVQKSQDVSFEIKALKDNIKDLEKKLSNCMKAVDSGMISSTLTARVQDYERQLTFMREDVARKELLDQRDFVDQETIEFFFHSLAKRVANDDRYKYIIVTALIQAVIIHEHAVEIRFNYRQQNTPVLQNPVTLECSDNSRMVDHQGIEPWTP
ncbi:recombinase family protein [Megasphaera hominis]|uniref:Recombinase family protein n=1 Tax=Megasphaera hominis TaxID=159836 RepID=A0ABR6VKV2_9FIRM|nr:recombinase family protein [Megasphaera hominis]